jgi:hypothetical protein
MLVELYWMETSDDAFGLLSNDWGGEQVRPATGTSPIELYGAGLLRVWSGNLYARILAEKETPASRERVLELGRAIAAGRPETPRPALWAALPPSLDAGHALAADRICYLRSHLVLNSVYFLSSGNILDLDRRTEAVIAPYRTPSPPAPGTPPPARPAGVELMIIRYPDRTAARAALSHFVHAFLPESSPALEPNRQQLSGFARVEHGWVGYGLDGRSLVLIFDAPDQSLARQGIARATESLENLERPHE